MIRLTKREKRLAAALAAFALAWSLYALVVAPAKQRIATLKRVIPQKQKELADLRAAVNEYAALNRSLADLRDKLAAQPETFELLPFLESMIQTHGLEANLAKMQQRPVPLGPDCTQTIVEIELHGLPMAKIVDFLHRIEAADILARTRSLYIKKNHTNKDLLDTVIEVNNPKLTNHLAQK